MKTIQIIHKGEVVSQFVVNDCEVVILKELIKKYDNELFERIYNLYKIEEHSCNYWFECDGKPFQEDIKFKICCDIVLDFKIEIEERNGVNSGFVYNGIDTDIDYLSFTCMSANCAIQLLQYAGLSNPYIEYSFNKTDWNVWNYSPIILHFDEIVYLRGYNPNGFNDQYNRRRFIVGSSMEFVKVGGDIQTLLDWNNIPDSVHPYEFVELFRQGNIISAPKLSARILAEDCYKQMFHSCTLLTNVIELPAEILPARCYDNMFNGCTNLDSIKVGALDWNGGNSTTNWVDGVSAIGTFTKPSGTIIPIGTNGIPTGWTVINE